MYKRQAQTTRHRIRGIINEDDYQIVLSDTPGILNPSYKLQEAMMKFIKETLIDSDFLVIVEEVGNKESFDESLIQKLNSFKIPVILLVNKIDINNPDYVSEILRCEYNEGYNYGTFRIAIERFVLELKSLNISYQALYLYKKDNPNSFIWINNIYKENFSSEISSNWIKNPIAENIKKEFIENAKCIDARAYDAFLIT